MKVFLPFKFLHEEDRASAAIGSWFGHHWLDGWRNRVGFALQGLVNDTPPQLTV